MASMMLLPIMANYHVEFEVNVCFHVHTMHFVSNVSMTGLQNRNVLHS